MKKLSLSRILLEMTNRQAVHAFYGRKLKLEDNQPNQDLEDWSAGLEGEDDDTTQAPQDVDPQSVWGGPKLNDYNDRGQQDEVWDNEGYLQQKYRLNSDEMDRISRGDFSTVMKKIGDPENFAGDVAKAFGTEIGDAVNNFVPKLNPNPVAGPKGKNMSLNKALPNQLQNPAPQKWPVGQQATTWRAEDSIAPTKFGAVLPSAQKALPPNINPAPAEDGATRKTKLPQR